MKLRLKPGYRYEPCRVKREEETVVTRIPETDEVIIRNGGMEQTLDVTEGGSWTETAFCGFNAAGWENPWWEVVSLNDDADAELTAAAEGEGPSIDDDAEACRRHRASLHRIQVVDDGAVNRCRCAWVVTEPPAPRLCAVDRLEAAGYALHVNDEFRRLHIMRPGSLTVFATNVLNTGRWEAWIDDGPKTACVYARGDESPGLNAALESLLSKPVGAVTVAQILGVSP